jgi:hypothetical protein
VLATGDACRRRPPRWPTARSCTGSTSTTPTPAASSTPPPSCCPPRSRSASRSRPTAPRCSLRPSSATRRSAGSRCREPHGFHARGLHATQVAGTLAAAAVAAKLWGSTPRRPRTRSASPDRAVRRAARVPQHGASTKQLHPGGASHERDPRRAARGRRRDRPGHRPRRVRTGSTPRSRRAAADVESVVTDGSGERWETTRITIKPYPSCQLMHVTLDALREVLACPLPTRSKRSWPTCTPTPPDRVRAGRGQGALPAPPTTRSSRCRGRSPRCSSTAMSRWRPTTWSRCCARRSPSCPRRVTTVVDELSGGVAADAAGKVEVTCATAAVLTAGSPRSLGRPGPSAHRRPAAREVPRQHRWTAASSPTSRWTPCSTSDPDPSVTAPTSLRAVRPTPECRMTFTAIEPAELPLVRLPGYTFSLGLAARRPARSTPVTPGRRSTRPRGSPTSSRAAWGSRPRRPTRSRRDPRRRRAVLLRRHARGGERVDRRPRAYYAEAREVRSALFGEHSPTIVTVVVDRLVRAKAFIEVEVHAEPGGGELLLR